MSEPTEPHGRRPDDALATALKRAADVRGRLVPVPVAHIKVLGTRRRRRMLATAVACAVGVLGTAGALTAVRLQPDHRPAAPVVTPMPSPPLTPSPSLTTSPSASSSLAQPPAGSGAPADGAAPGGIGGSASSASPSIEPTASAGEESGEPTVSESPDDSTSTGPVVTAHPSDTVAESAAAIAPAPGS
ncbi:hypothetical protein [Streptomyces sp. T028]|uniref:hypothetical protein n=1 Tax=Streptomyces sp. T028 TaxID=3394379 RepID=UPI003A87072A